MSPNEIINAVSRLLNQSPGIDPDRLAFKISRVEREAVIEYLKEFEHRAHPWLVPTTRTDYDKLYVLGIELVVP